MYYRRSFLKAGRVCTMIAPIADEEKPMNEMKTAVLLCVALVVLAGSAFAAEPAAPTGDKKKVLVYTRNYVTNGKGFVHDNIQTSIEAITKMGEENGFDVD